MSRRNLVNKDHYVMRGRLAPDDIARERRNQQQQAFGETRRRTKGGPVPPWMANDAQNSAEGAGGNDEGDQAAQRPQAKPRPNAQGKMVSGGSNEKKTERRTRERVKQETQAGTTRGARSAQAKPRSTPKASGASGTPGGGKAPRSRGAAARGGSPQRAGEPGAHKRSTAGANKPAASRKKGSKNAATRTGAGQKTTKTKRANGAKGAKKR